MYRQYVSVHGTPEAAALVNEMEEAEEEEARQSPDWTAHIAALTGRRSKENYRLLPEVRRQALLEVGVLDWIQVDLFASKANTTHPTFITPRMDAFIFHRSSLAAGPHKVL